MRARIATYVKEHPAAFRPYFHVNEVDPKAADQQAAQEHIRKVENGEAPKNWQEYLQAIFRPQRYADEIAFRAAAALLGVNLCLVCGSNLDKPDQVLFYQNPKASVILYLRHALGHYTLLIPRSEQLPDYVLTGAEVSSPQAFAPRGGGKSEAVDDSWIPRWGCSPSPLPEPKQQVALIKQEHASSTGVASSSCAEVPQPSRAGAIKREPSPVGAPGGGGKPEAMDDSWLPQRGSSPSNVTEPKPQVAKVKQEPTLSAGVASRSCAAVLQTPRAGAVKREPSPVSINAMPLRRLRRKVKLESLRECRVHGFTSVTAPALVRSPRVLHRRLRRKTSLAALIPAKHEVSGTGTQGSESHWSNRGREVSGEGARGSKGKAEHPPEQATADPPTASEHWTTRDAKRRSEKCKNAKNQFAWKCDVCNITLTTGLYDTLRFARNNHICRVHKGVPKNRFSQLGPPPRRPIPLVYDCSDPKWMCFHCRWFLPACHRRVKANSIAKHIRECEQCPLHWSPIRNLCAILEEHGIRTLGEHQARLAQRFKSEVDLRTYRPKKCKQEPPSKQDPRTGFVRDLTKDGDVERQPGPSTSCDGVSRGHHTQVCTWNSQGSQNLLRAAANGLLWGSGVVMVQEAGLDAHLCRELSVMATRHHFHAFFREAECFTDVIGRPRRKHGLATFVHQDCAARLVQSTGVPGTFEALCVKVGRTFVVNVYRVPSGAEAAYCDFLQNSMQLGNHVVIGGDHNLEGHQLPGLDEFIRCVRDEGGDPLSSRVNGQRCIDYFISQGVCLSGLGYGAETLGDHHCVHATAENLVHASRRASDDTLWVDQPTTRYCCPDGVSLEAWTATQAEVWHHARTPADEGDTEDEWRWFCATAEAGLRHATTVLGTLRDPPNHRAKGTLHRAQRVSGKTLRAGQRGPYALRRLLRLQGRVREMCRQAGRGFDAALSCQVERTWPASLGAYPGSEDAAHLLSIVDAAVADMHRKQTREGVHRWQCNLAKCGRQATAWLRGKQRVLTTVLPHEADRVPSEALTIGDSLGNIRRFWRTVWHRPVVDRQSAVRQWKLHGRRSVFRGRLAQIFTAGNLAAQAKRKAGSSPGVDGWSGDEVAALAPEAWRAFETLLLRWFRRGSFPQVWQQSRQIHLPKDEPDIKSGSLRADQLRPITIMSVWWRVVGSCFATHETVQRWLGQIVDESQVGGLRHRSLHMGIGSICESFEEGSAIASLDYQKCFDSVSPDLACDVLAEAGLPEPVLTALRCMWRQTRFLELSGYTSESGEVVHTSLPQGDAISPLALNVLLAAACKDIRAQSGGHFRQSVFLDDRVLAADAISMPAALQKWAEWSRILGLQENQRKQAVICKSAEGQRNLREVGLRRFLAQHVRVLGVDLCATVDAERPVAAARMEEALRRGARLINSAIPLTIRRELWRTRIVPRASWGHLMAPPSGVCLKNLVATFKQVACSHKMGSTALRRLLEGHVMDVHFMAGMHSIRAWRKTGRAEALAQHLSAGTWFKGVVQFLNEHGWRHVAQGTFVTEGCRLDLLAEEPAKADHKVRNQWRKTLFQEFCSASRRDSQMLRRWRFNEKQVAQARVLYQGASQEGRAVMLGAAHSTAFYRKQRDGDELQGCSKCGCNVVPSWEHLVWECTGIHGVEDRPVRPAATEANRLGWPMVGESVNAAARRLRWMGSVREQVRERMGCDE